MSTTIPFRYYRPELDILRFFAFSLVFLSHVVPGDAAFYAPAHFPPALAGVIVSLAAGGAFGVDLFFALSSFLITTLLLREQENCGSIDVRSFYVRRILRIWPLYFAFLLIVTPLARFVLPDAGMPVRYTLAFALLSGNWACAAWGWPHSVASPLWSVSLEEQFYLSWPLILRRWTGRLVAIASGLLVVAWITRFYLVAHGAVHPQIWCNTLARLDPIACGALLAVYANHRKITLSPAARVVLVSFGITTLTLIGHFEDFVGGRMPITLPAATVASIALILATLDLTIPVNGATRALIYLGRISYGLYVFHSLFVAICSRAAVALLATIATAAVSYHFLEKPFLRLKERFTRIQSRPA